MHKVQKEAKLGTSYQLAIPKHPIRSRTERTTFQPLDISFRSRKRASKSPINEPLKDPLKSKDKPYLDPPITLYYTPNTHY